MRLIAPAATPGTVDGVKLTHLADGLRHCELAPIEIPQPLPDETLIRLANAIGRRLPVGAVTVVRPDSSDLGTQLQDDYCGADIVIDGYRRLQAVCALFGYSLTAFGPQNPLCRTSSGHIRIEDGWSDASIPTARLLSRGVVECLPFMANLSASALPRMLEFHALREVELPVIAVPASTFDTFQDLALLRQALNREHRSDAANGSGLSDSCVRASG